MKISENIYTFKNLSNFTTITLSLFCCFQRATAQSLFPSTSFNTSCNPTPQSGLNSFNTNGRLFDHISFEEFQEIDPKHTLIEDEDFRSFRLLDLVATSESGAIHSLSRKDKKTYKKNPRDEKIQKLIRENFELRFKKGLHREVSIVQSKKSYNITIGTTYILKESQNPDTYYGKLTGDNHLAYARHWGMNGRIVAENLLQGKCSLENGTVTDCVPYWNKIELLRAWLKETADPKKEQWYVILDHDMVITNMNVNPYEQLQILRKGHNTSIIVGRCSAQSKEEQAFACWKNGNPDLSISTSIMLVRKDEYSKKFFDRVWEKRNDPTGSKTSICPTLGTCQTQEFLHEQEAFARVLAEEISLLGTVVTAVGTETYQGKQLALDNGKREGCFILINPKEGEIEGPLGFDYDNVYPENIWKVGDWIGHTPGLPLKALDCETKKTVYLRETYLKALIKETIPIDTPDFPKKTAKALRKDFKYEDPFIRELLSKVSPNSPAYAIIKAAGKGDATNLEDLLKEGLILEEERGRSILAAATNGDMESLEILIGHRQQVSDDYRGPALIKAAKKGYKEIIARILKEGNVFSPYLYKATEKAAVNGHLDVLDFFLSNKVIPEHQLGFILVETAKTFHSSSIETLLEYGEIYGISDQHLGIALWQASMKGCTNTVELLLKTGRVDSYRKLARNTALRNHRPNIVKLLSEANT